MCLLLARVALVVGSTTIIGVSWVPAFARMTVCAVGARLSSAGVCGVTGFDPVLFAALVLESVLVTHGRQLTDDPRRGVSVEVRAVSDDEGIFVGEQFGGPARVLEPDRAWQVRPLVGGLSQHFEQDEVLTPVHLRFQLFPRYGLHRITSLVGSSRDAPYNSTQPSRRYAVPRWPRGRRLGRGRTRWRRR